MLLVTYKHPLHGKQELPCKKLEMRDGQMHVVNVHGVTYQVIDPDRIMKVQASLIK